MSHRDPHAESAGDQYPPGLANIYLFAVFNALSFQMVLGNPMILYARNLGASATVLGIIAGMMPLLVIFQIPAARHVGRLGYKRFVFAGWGMRVMFIGWMALLPLTGIFLTPTTRLALLLMLLFGFNLSRGISSCAWLPWITSLVPGSLRGGYLARESACVNVSSAVAFVFAAFCLGAQPNPWQFSVVFAFSAVMGMASLVFLKRIPEGGTPDEVAASSTAVPWRALAGHRPFRRLLRLNVAWSAAYGGLTAFIVAYLKTEAGLDERSILLFTAAMFLGGLGGLAWFGPQLDRVGSKPVLGVAFGFWLAIMGGWALLSGRAFELRWSAVVILQLLMGFAIAVVNMANLRLAMSVIPAMGRSHFFALFSVVGNLTQGVAPVLWGLLIDAMGSRRFPLAGIEINRFSVFFLVVWGVFGVALVLSRWLEEPAARPMDELLRDLMRSPIRAWFRIWPRS